ncbi:acyl carrier protein [Cohnella cholangitidis]|uniref:Acyl carrier protein n=1 Tax=Cohnella cholangitidis TaxID=2598458 RepID=A0A7G5BVJ3_9BACL|nr:acyl carrier protein [Cohnella cholangitidis]QMV40977.1 acyl carrier protein [Cohnella cholangitidis]
MDKSIIEQKVCQWVREKATVPSEEIALDADLRDNYGIDSISLVELLVEIECAFDMTFDSASLTNDYFSTAGSISEYVCRKLAVSA